MYDQMARVRFVSSAAGRVDQLPEDDGHVSEQPYLHELVTIVHAPGLAVGAGDGQVRDGVHGFFVADRRALSRLVVRVDGREPAGVRGAVTGSGRARFVGIARNLGDGDADPTVSVQRDRQVSGAALVETVSVTSFARDPVDTVVEVELGCDLAEMAAVKAGVPTTELVPTVIDGGLDWAEGAVRATAGQQVSVDGSTLRWPVSVARGDTCTLVITVVVAPQAAPVVAAATAHLPSVEVHGDDDRLTRLLAQSLTDLDSLLLSDPMEPADHFLAAGVPWFLTLFGRDSIWAARMLLPLGTAIAGGTLRALARRQGDVVDPSTAQEPGKIMHEIRPRSTVHGAMQLPPLYYGTVDATALWVSLLHDAWRWGMPVEDVAALLPHLQRAMQWITGHDGFVSYRDPTGSGLANQGWKDSGDSVQFRDGTLATAPIALCEVQGYCFAAAREAAELADAFGLAGADGWRTWADRLGDRFRESFWVDDPHGRFPAIALDAAGRRADTVTSNIAHLLGTGLLDDREEAAVVERLGRADMDSGYGMRTMSTTSAGYNPLAYHGGSVWTHDTAIAITALAGSAVPAAAAVATSYLRGLLAAAPAFDHRMPELFGGHPRADYPVPVPYPASCRPQAWAATASVAMVTAALGLHADVPNGSMRLRPLRPSPVGALEVFGLRFGADVFSVALDADGDPVVRGLPRAVRVSVE